jgi:hypothetical protein
MPQILSKEERREPTWKYVARGFSINRCDCSSDWLGDEIKSEKMGKRLLGEGTGDE